MRKAELEHVLVQLPIAVCIIDEARTIVFANAAFSGGLTLRQEDLTGRLLDDVFPQQIRFLKRKINSVFALKNPSFSYWQQRPHVFPMSSSRPITGDESEMYQNVQFIPLLDSADEVSHLCMVISDVTAEASYFLQQSELKAALEEEHQQLQKLHAELKQAQQQMLQSEKMASIGQLAAGVAHEINNPVGFVRSNLETMQDYTSKLIKIMDRQQKIILKQAEPRFIALLSDLYERLGVAYIQSDLPDLIEESLVGTERVRSIVKSLRDFATYDDEGWVALDLAAVIRSALALLENEIKYKAKAELELPEQNALIWAKAASIRQLLFNVILNALQAMQPMGLLRISCTLQQDSIELIIQDNGCGMDNETLSRIFDPFFTTKAVGQGTGLGLAEVYNIVQEHEATMQVDSELGTGTRFRFCFKAYRG